MENFQSHLAQNRYDRQLTSPIDMAMENDSTISTANEPITDADPLTRAIIRVANQRDKAAFAELFSHFMPKIRAFGLQRLNQQGLAMDLVQETMTLVWTKAHLYNADKGSVATWVFTIMRNQCFDMLRRIQHNREDAFGDDIWPIYDVAVSHEGGPDHKLTAKLLAHLDALPLPQRQVVQGIYMQELTQQELADALKVPIGTIKSRLRLGLEKLKSFLETQHD
ncbi:sigma-70 family RNA polymerase sigma factor [Shewanella seohaensis]|uniref:sigma-70 family RNA polymerase sigma factor n=1 Tax=Shewanella seohaensis TaxID=755175 RepID=UPI00200C1A57|nr:sigma-70 family RNA polymerase sigma factor [Shewanella seohaensis]MCL1119620.1 sigma-70 family RNA polymerase sigma factor [Shewanella seohaensis]UXM80486.1 sigma-70 family RNA polymerase sigma factor [Shewanella seohaensis]